MVKKPPFLAKLYLGPFQKAKLLVKLRNPGKFMLLGHWEVQAVTTEGMSLGLWFYTTKLRVSSDFITPEEKRNCYLIFRTGEIEPETKVPEQQVKELNYLWSMGVQSAVTRALGYLNKRGLIPDPTRPKLKEKSQGNCRYNARGEPVS